MKPDGNEVVLENTNNDGNIIAPIVPEGSYQIRMGNIVSRTWHTIPQQGSCNTCHEVGGNGSEVRTKTMHSYHTGIPSDNDCTHCHHFPATMSISRLMTPGVLNVSSSIPAIPGSQVDILGQVFNFDPGEYDISSVRSDIFAEGYFSMFDVIIAVAASNGIDFEYHYDDSRKTHFITKINGIGGDYWYHFSYDAGLGNSSEIRYRRANRWDETLWRPGVWIQVVQGEDLNEIKDEYLDEINRENTHGHIVPQVRISINPSSYQGNPTESGRITVTREFEDVQVTPHNIRSVGYPSPHSKPFQPGVVTSMDILYSLMDQGELNVATGVFYSYFVEHYVDSYYIVELGFPSVGTAHSSGRHGIVYTTENGTPNRLPNNADRKLHMTSDINVIHAPDFSQWRWIELGNPYYENDEPTSVTHPSIQEDYDAINRGFNLHSPWPNPFNHGVNISFNLFEPGIVNISIYNTLGQLVITLVDKQMENIGIQRLKWQPGNLPTGRYHIIMKFGRHMQIREVTFLK